MSIRCDAITEGSSVCYMPMTAAEIYDLKQQYEGRIESHLERRPIRAAHL